MSAHNNKILLVDDTLANLQILGDILRQEGYHLTVAQNGKQAIESIHAIPPDLILLDIMMPDMDGFETCQILKENPATSQIPVIFLTARVQAEDIVKGFHLGAVDYIPKPFNSTELLARIRNQLNLKEAYQQIEQQKQLLEQQNSQLIEAAKLREDVDRIMKHDLKNPLNSIISFPQLLLMTESLPETAKTYLKMIHKSGLRMLQMINFSLDLYKIEVGTYQLKPEQVDLKDTILQIENEVENLRSMKNVSIIKTGSAFSENIPAIISGEFLLCYSMLSNLIKNAIEAAPENTQVYITLEINDHIIIMIHNQGLVPSEIKDRFFEKYVTSGKESGTGLGTYSSKLIAETMNGSISMNSSTTDGTTITLNFPIKPIPLV